MLYEGITDIINLDGGKTVNGNRGIFGMDMLNQIFIPLNFQFGMNPALKQNLRTADFKQFIT